MRLHLGCHDHILDDFLNIDILPMRLNSERFMQWDLRQGMPKLETLATTIFHEHLIEHILPIDTIPFLKNCFNALESGGKHIIGAPNFRQLCERYLANDWDFFSHVLSVAPNHQMLEIINDSLYQRQPDGVAEHVQMLDSDYALFLLESAGYIDCKVIEPPPFSRPSRHRYTFYVSGEKP